MHRFLDRGVFPFSLRVFLVLSLIVASSPSGFAQRRPANPIVVQVAALKSRASADEVAVALKGKGLQATVVPGDDYNRVVVGPFPNDAAANDALTSLKAQGYDGYIRKDLALPGAAAATAAPRPAAPRPSAPRPAPRPAQTAPSQAPPVQPAPAPAPANPPGPITGITNQPTGTQPPAAAEPPAATPPVAVAPPPAAAEPTPAPPPEPEPTVAQAEPEPAPPVPPSEPAAAEPETPSVVATQQVEPIAAPAQPEPAPTETATAAPPEPSAQPGQVAGSRLRMLVLEGAGAINNTRQRTAREPVVQVVDENDRPVAGVAITFALPSRGASGVFANGARSMTVLTNAQGTATATGFTPNAVAGEMSMQVTGSYQGQTLSATIAQTNVAAGAGMSAATIGIIGAVAAGAAVGAVLALTGGDSAPNTPARPSGTASVRPGGVTIGAPSN